MRSHFLLLALFAFFVSLVFALHRERRSEEQVRFGGMMFAGFLGAGRRARLADVSVSVLRPDDRCTDLLRTLRLEPLELVEPFAPPSRFLWPPVVAYMALIFGLSSISQTPASSAVATSICTRSSIPGSARCWFAHWPAAGIVV